jgi:hypothetical protein
MTLPYSVPLLLLPLLLLPVLLLLLPPPKDLAMLSVKEPRMRLAPMLAKPKALPICVDGTLHSKDGTVLLQHSSALSAAKGRTAAEY